MRWKQFFTPVESVDSHQGHELIAKQPLEDLTIGRPGGFYDQG